MTIHVSRSIKRAFSLYIFFSVYLKCAITSSSHAKKNFCRATRSNYSLKRVVEVNSNNKRLRTLCTIAISITIYA